MSSPLQVPPELKDDLILIADNIEPYLLEIKEQAKKIPEKAHELAQKIEPAAEQLGEKIEQGAAKVQPFATAQQLQCIAFDNATHKITFAFFRNHSVCCMCEFCMNYIACMQLSAWSALAISLSILPTSKPSQCSTLSDMFGC